MPMRSNAVGSMPALSPNEGKCVGMGMDGGATGGAVPNGLSRTGGAVEGTGTLETGGVGMEERPPPIASVAPQCGSLGWRDRWCRRSRRVHGGTGNMSACNRGIRLLWQGNRRNSGHGSAVSDPPHERTHGGSVHVKVGI